MDERQWIYAIQRGDKRYLQDIVEKYYDDIFRFCTFQTGSREDAYDLAQETFLRFIRYVEGYHYRNLKGYLLTIAMNLCRDHLAEKGRREEREISFDREIDGGGASESDSLWELYQFPDPDKTERSPEWRLLESDVHDRLMKMLVGIPQMQREALLLHYLYDMRYREIAKLTDVSVSTVKSRVKQGMEKLRGVMNREDFLD
ncbi:MAG: RNA polymerase sigma factor [Eubacterium sp.]|nr:RNA polymerase sigma factor [Eubacterium sp.]MCM1303515.1 RNA polymerase sigma factor [Butyrivibrio sp.]MCM1342721.1 RNA polymerase sigma factor [Muribaculaceae bacterium]MCM1410015.1 RNA polymerase sigma factor [Lachnospiraceae bacterium]